MKRAAGHFPVDDEQGPNYAGADARRGSECVLNRNRPDGNPGRAQDPSCGSGKGYRGTLTGRASALRVPGSHDMRIPHSQEKRLEVYRLLARELL